jgi:hypothetical protein
MLSSGTNAPLYKSAFLNRADPEAQLEAYERRLALALDVDQTDRILAHSSASSPENALQSGAASQTKHVWRDGAWIKDGVALRLSSLRINSSIIPMLTVSFSISTSTAEKNARS